MKEREKYTGRSEGNKMTNREMPTRRHPQNGNGEQYPDSGKPDKIDQRCYNIFGSSPLEIKDYSLDHEHDIRQQVDAGNDTPLFPIDIE
jgi:hypothetical protein